MPSKNRSVALFYPPITYDIAQFVLFPVNYAIGGLCYLQPSKSVWNTADFDARHIAGSGKAIEQIKADILQQKDMAHHEEDLVRLYDALPAACAQSDLVGRSWQGKILRTNASVLDLAEWLVIRPLSRIGIRWGKRYRTSDKGDPLLFSWRDKLHFPIPAWGNVGMTDIKWRGVSTATMNYDHQPWKDYFKILANEDGKVILLGVWTHRHIAGGWFTLTLDTNLPA